MKSFPIEALSHAPLTAMMKTVKEHNIKADDVKEIKVEVIARAADILGDPHKYRPDSKETADHSLPYCMAAGLVDGMVTPLQFKEERVLDKALIPIMDKVKVVPNEEFEALFPKFQPSRVTITTNERQVALHARRCSQGRSARSDDRGRDRGEVHRAGRRRHRQGSMQEVAELHHEHGDRQRTWRTLRADDGSLDLLRWVARASRVLAMASRHCELRKIVIFKERPFPRTAGKKFVSAGRRDQHARRARTVQRQSQTGSDVENLRYNATCAIRLASRSGARVLLSHDLRSGVEWTPLLDSNRCQRSKRPTSTISRNC